MIKKLQLLALALSTASLTMATTSNANAQENGQDYVSIGIGFYDVNDNEGAVDFRAEYRSGISVMDDNMHPWAGGEFTSDGSFWAGGGLLYDWDLENSWHIIPNFGAGLYAQGGSDKDLGHAIEFRSQLEAAYQFESGQRAGAAISHLSNASLDDKNPGTEVLNLYWHVPY